MAYESGTASTIEALAQALHDFAVAQGWTSNIFSAVNHWMAFNNGTSFYQFRWDTDDGICIFQSTGFVDTSTAPGNHTNDDGFAQIDGTAPYDLNVSAAASTTTGRRQLRVDTSGPFVAYHLFSDDSQQYIHMAVEITAGDFVFMSVGEIDKIGDWTGGQYAAGDASAGESTGFGYLTFLAPGSTSAGRCMFAIRAEGLPDQGTGRWLGSSSFDLTPLINEYGNDAAGNPRGCCMVCGGGESLHATLMNSPASLLTGLLPLFPVEVWRLWEPTTGSEQGQLLGYVPGVYTINITNFADGQEFTIGSDTYKVFPIRSRTYSSNSYFFPRGVAFLKTT